MEKQASSATFDVVDLFCGAGGLSLGFRQAGFRVIHAVDNWAAAVNTYRANLGNHVLCESISRSIELPAAHVFSGGPPCQGFSSAGPRRKGDIRNSLVGEFAEIVANSRPLAFVFENVEGFLTYNEGEHVFELLDKLIGAGYQIHLRKVNAANYGVAQHRKRVIAIGGLGWAPSFPKPTHSTFGAPGAELANESHLQTSRTMRDVLAGLPPAISREANSTDECHTYTPLNDDDLRRAQYLRPGQSMQDLPESLWHPSYRRRAFRRVQDGTPTERRGGPPSGLRRLCLDEPSKAITGGAIRDFLHPIEDRPLTIRECGVLQTFPVNYDFLGSNSERIQQIGNAVPPMLTKAIADSLKQDLECKPLVLVSKGSLLSFAPTLSMGMSPVLLKLSERIKKRYFARDAVRVQRALWD